VPYRIKIDVFEGPFDLLLFLIRKNEVDIYDIPIAKITGQFLDYIKVMEVLDLDIAGDFIEVVAILMHIKARMLLPQSADEDGEDYEDPRLELVEKLIEYKRFKDAAVELEDFEHERSLIHTRKYFQYISRETDVTDEEYLEKVTFFDLIMAFREAIKNMPKVSYHEVNRSEVSVEEQTTFLMGKLAKGETVLFQALMKTMKTKIMIIVTFIAILELTRKGTIMINQSEMFQDIRLKLRPAA